jgi:hypothetical protein
MYKINRKDLKNPTCDLEDCIDIMKGELKILYPNKTESDLVISGYAEGENNVLELGYFCLEL